MRTGKRTSGGGSASDYERHLVDQLWPSVDDVLPDQARAEIAASAADADRTGRLSVAGLALLGASGYFGFPVPTELEGKGGSIVACCAVQRVLGSLDPALAVAVNMHLFSVGVLVEHWRRERDASWALLEAIATQQRVVASGFAERGLAGSILRSELTVDRVEDGYRVSGRKVPCSLAAVADLICFQAQEAGDGPESLLVCLMPMTAPGISVERSWDALGMRGSGSDTVVFDDCHIPENLVFHRCRPGFDADEVFAAGLGWFCVTTTATYLGVVAGALKEAQALLSRSRVSHLDRVRADVPTFQASVGAAVGRLLSLELSCLQLATLLDDRGADPRALLPLGLALKDHAAEVITSVMEDLIEAVGAQSYGANSGMSRLWRDVQAVRFHPPTRFATRQILGRWSLGRSFSFDVHE